MRPIRQPTGNKNAAAGKPATRAEGALAGTSGLKRQVHSSGLLCEVEVYAVGVAERSPGSRPAHPGLSGTTTTTDPERVAAGTDSATLAGLRVSCTAMVPGWEERGHSSFPRDK
jgi:hypothetical protein